MTSTMNPFRIVLADRHPSFRHGLRRVLGGNTDIDVIGEAGNSAELINLLNLSKLAPHLVILDISMPDFRGMEAFREIKTTHPEVRFLILGMHPDNEYASQAISNGADGYVLKRDVDTELFSAIETIRRGSPYVSPLLSENAGISPGQMFTKEG